MTPRWFRLWVNAMAYYIITLCGSSILATLFLLAHHPHTAFAISQAGLVLSLGALYLDYRRLTSRPRP